MMPGQMYPGIRPTRNVPSWALILVGVLVGFLMAMTIFKFTGMGAALRGDLIEEGREKAKKHYEAELKQLKADGFVDEEKEEEPEKKDGEDPAGGGGGGGSEPETEGEGEATDTDADPGAGEDADEDA